MDENNIVEAIHQGSPLPPETVIDWRATGMQKVRLELITRLLRLNIQIITLSIYWEDGRSIAQRPTLQKIPLKLVYATMPRVTGKFDDANLLCYTHDAESRAVVDAEIDRMVAVIADFLHRQSTP
ncbi:MAG: hypothetical protein AB7E73_08185 [Burkholderiales bacterium]